MVPERSNKTKQNHMKCKIFKLLKVFVATTVIASIGIIGCSKSSNSTITTPPPTPSRYKESVFTEITTVSNITYGSNTTYAGNTKTLQMDIYYPSNDTATSRPLLILMPGGGFLANTDKSVLADESMAIAKFGYVVACINYRCFDGTGAMTVPILKQLIVEGIQDAKAAIRFFRKDAANGNTYKINTNKIFLGGHSAGGIDAAHTVYLDTITKADTSLQTLIIANGGLEGNSGNSGYSSSVTGLVCLAGALLEKTYITAGSKPMIGMYGTLDNYLTYNDGQSLLPNDSSIMVSGSNSMYNRAVSVGISNCVVDSIIGGDHFAPIQTNCTDCLSKIAGFMYKLL
jgi:hypothetical protein